MDPLNVYSRIKTGDNDRHILRSVRYLTKENKKVTPKNKSVYFVLASDNLVKIGHSSNVKKRIQNLSVLHPSFKLLGMVDGKTELEVHNIFSDFRISGEWYKYDQSMIEYINLHKPQKN